MIFKVKNNQFIENKQFKRQNKKYKILSKNEEVTFIEVHKNNYFDLSFYLGGDTISNNSFEVVDYEEYDDYIFKLGVGEVHKPFRGMRRENNYSTKQIDNFRQYLEDNNIRFRYIDYDLKSISFRKMDVKIIIDYLESACCRWKSITNYFDSIVVCL